MYTYKVQIYKDQAKEKEFKIDQYPIAFQNDKYIILNDSILTKLEKENSKYRSNPTPGHPVIFSMMESTKWESIVYTLYSVTAVKPEKIKKQLNTWLQNKYGWLSSIDLDFIK